MKDLNIEQITPDPVMAILHVWLMYMKSWLVILCVRLFSRLSDFSVYLSHAGD